MKNNRLIKIIISLISCIAVITSAIFIGIYFYNKSNSNNFSDDNYISLDYGFTDVTVTDEKSALEAISSVSDVVGINNVDDELKISSTNTIDNDTYYKFQQYYNGIPVYGKSVCLVCDKDGQAAAMTANYIKPRLEKTIVDTVSDDEIQKSIKNYFDTYNIYVDKISDDNLVYYIDIKNEMQLAYKVISYSKDNIYEIIINAKNAEIISSISILDNESVNIYSKKSRDLSAIGWKNDDNSYHLYNEKYNISVFDFKKAHTNLKEDNGENKILLDFTEYGVDTIYSKTDEFEEDAVLLLKNLIKVNDYYNELGFDGFYRTHACLNDKRFYKNAAGGSAYNEDNQNCAIMYIGEKSDAGLLDLIGHEYTHAITRSIVSWNGEEPGINEGFSDVFGELFEYYINGETDWMHGPRIIRNPSENNYPQNINDENNSGEDDSHGYSTVISHAAYLMWNGIEGNERKSINCNTLSKLWYRSLSLLQSNTTFSQCRNAVELSARIMFKNGELTLDQYKCVCEAFDIVGIDRANYTYQSKVKNDFNLKVLSIEETDNVNFKLRIYKLRNYEFDIKSIIKQPKLVLEENSLYGNKKLNLDDGIYKFEITDLDENSQNFEPITIKIIVDGNSENAVDEVTVRTDFSDITTVILNEEEKTSKKLTITDFLGLEFGNLISSYGENYDICDAEGWIPSSPSGERMVGYKNIPFSFLVWTGRDEPLIPYENDEITDVMFTKSLSTENYSIDGKINTDIIWLELQNNTTGTKWIDGQYYAYSYKIENPLGDISIIFQYEDMPKENSVADFIIATDYFDVPEEDWMSNTLYQPIIEKHRSVCEKNHSYYNDIVCCTWFLFDVDKNGIDELIIQDGGAEQAKYHHYYTIKDNKVTELGEYNAWHMGLYEEDGSLFGKVVSPNGPTELYQISIVDNKVEKILIKTTDDVDYPFYSNSIMPMDISYNINDYN